MKLSNKTQAKIGITGLIIIIIGGLIALEYLIELLFQSF